MVAAAGARPEVTTRWSEGGIVIAWNNPKGVRHADIIEYHVWMDNYGNAGTGNPGSQIGPVLAPDQTSATPLSGALGSFDHHTIIDETGWEPHSYQYADTNHELQSVEIELLDGIKVGTTHNFWVSGLYRRTSPADGTVTYWETSGVFGGRATYLLRPVPVSPGGPSPTDFVDLENVTFEWEGSRGADLYRIEVSTSYNFERDNTWCSDVYRPTSVDGMLHTELFPNVLNNAPELANVTPGQTIYWRVGARNKADRPGPYPAGPSPSLNGPKNTRFIYSAPDSIFAFMIPEEVPGPPPNGDGDGGNGGDGPPPPPPL